MQHIYLDHAATTPLHPDVLEAMLPYYREFHGNPSSLHSFGQRTRHAVDEARSVIAESLHALPSEIIFTSGGTEADNTAIMGIATALKDKGRHIITSQIEHHAVIDTCAFLEKNGYDVTYIPVDKQGRVSPESVRQAIREDTILISIMYGNNEVGTVQPISEIGAIAQEKGIYFHTDAVQAYGMERMDVRSLPVDLLSISAHKINGPKGMGALYIGKNVKINPHLHGGNQEKKRRAGTENVAGIIGFAKAAEISGRTLEDHRMQYEKYRSIMLEAWSEMNVPFTVNGSLEHYLPHILNVSFPGTRTEMMLMNLDIAGIAAASGSACTAGSFEVSHVLEAMGVAQEILQSALRFSFGYGNTEEQIHEAAIKTGEIVLRVSKAER
ncbi:cysteine desulfurase family protein [Aneurinibacillus sp. Ricciae_BoGa-3]|uniref:cysteine desulfurase family protein n=1 Tax=Aneurinibacillus sp. Ricciae_BoGa-3 TaxID=3022697 RepID=UPI00234094BA|nr:cysteine desulfurase family protein [Aneurinibacillus sp. Ricciae_BoGa-3]WCK53595.1 cysteine desulfurase family protein [Aneurinibacillus sp. Ricciae_BoGa-3]